MLFLLLYPFFLKKILYLLKSGVSMKITLNLSGIALAFLILASTAFAGPVSHYGALKVCGSDICGSINGTTSHKVLLKGPSLFWSDGYGAPFYRQEVVDWFVDEMQIGVIRAAMAIQFYSENSSPINQSGGTHGYFFNKATQKTLIKKVIDAAILNDIYVIVDWHSHNAHVDSEKNLAKDFFVEMANEYKNVPNIIWEVYNEPVGADAGQITSYSNNIINALRSASNNNLVLVGSNFYSSKPREQASNMKPAESKNVAFTFHFYAGTHPQSGTYGTSAAGTRTDGYAIFGTEWGAVNADGAGNVNTSESDNWTEWMDNNNISNCMWNASTVTENGQTSAFFKSGTNPGTISTSDIKDGAGKYFQTYMGKNKWIDKIPSNHPRGKDITVSVRDGESVTISSTDLNLRGNITEVDEVPFGELSIASDKKSITYKTSGAGSNDPSIRFTYKITEGSVTVKSKVIINITNRRPILPQISPTAVSRRAPTSFRLNTTLGARDPSSNGIELKSVSVSPSSAGTATITSGKDTIVFTPASNLSDAELTEATLNYEVATKGSGSTSNSASLDLRIQNMPPTITAVSNTTCCQPNSGPNTAAFGIGMKNFNAKDADGDQMKFDTVYLDPRYPGTIERVALDSFVYHPEAGKTGKVAFLAIVSDGNAQSNVGRANLTLTGSGTEFTITAPTEIPGTTPIIPGSKLGAIGAIGLNYSFGMVELYFAQSGFAKLDVYSLSGKNMGTLLSGFQNAGSRISLKNLNLQKGVYILRLKQGSQVKTIRIVN